MLLKVVDEIEEIQRVEGPPSQGALAEEDDATLVAAAQSGPQRRLTTAWQARASVLFRSESRETRRFVSRFGYRR
jgi:hypothetical protein